MEMLVDDARVREKLQINSDQLAKLQVIVSEFRSKRAVLLPQMAPGSSPDKAQSASAALRTLGGEARGKIAGVLAQPQLDGFHKIVMELDNNRGRTMLPRQDNGAPGGDEPDDLPGGGRPNADPMQMLMNSRQLQAELQLGEDQIRKLKRIEPEFRTKQGELLQHIQIARATLRTQAVEAGERLSKVLSKDQFDQLSLAAPARARPGGPGPGPEGPNGPEAGPAQTDPAKVLIDSAELQATLKLSVAQMESVRQIAADTRAKQAEPLKQIQSARTAMQVHMELARGMIARVLTRPQLDRFQQILVQVEGSCSAIRDENVSRILGLQPPQMREITALCLRLRTSIKAPPRGNSQQERCAAMEYIRVTYEKAKEQTEAQIMAMLSDGQRSALRSMAGRPLPMDPPPSPECN